MTTLFGPIGDSINEVPLYLKLYVITTLLNDQDQSMSYATLQLSTMYYVTTE